MTRPTNEQASVAWAITNVFETGSAEGEYGKVAVLPDGAGISYGKAQATDRSGSLDEIVYAYVDLHGKYAHAFAPFLARLSADPPVLQDNEPFKQLLAKCGHDPIMHEIQDTLFEERYWLPAVRIGERCNLVHPLSYAVLYDIAIQSGPGRISRLRSKFRAVPPAKGGDEQVWIAALNEARRAWLAAYPNPIVQRTVYRPHAYADLMDAGKWDLSLPLAVHGVTISAV